MHKDSAVKSLNIWKKLYLIRIIYSGIVIHMVIHFMVKKLFL